MKVYATVKVLDLLAYYKPFLSKIDKVLENVELNKPDTNDVIKINIPKVSEKEFKDTIEKLR